MLSQAIYHGQNRLSYRTPFCLNNDRALLRHGISVWIDVPIELVAKNMIEKGFHIPEMESSAAESYSKV